MVDQDGERGLAGGSTSSGFRILDSLLRWVRRQSAGGTTEHYKAERRAIYMSDLALHAGNARCRYCTLRGFK